MNYKNNIIYLILSAICFICVLLIGENDSIINHLGISNKVTTPRLVYRVYLSGKNIGIINSKEELEKYIDSEQIKIKEEYHVSNVYAPKSLNIVEEITFKEELNNVEEVYNKIKNSENKESFTINGYKVLIEGVEEKTETESRITENRVIYVLDKKVFEIAAENTIKAFISSEDYYNFINNSQLEIKDTGKIIENLYIQNNITISAEKIPITEKIYTNSEELSKYLLFNTNNDLDKYLVKDGDTIEKIAYNNKMSSEEFLIANTNFKTENDILFSGQEVKVSAVSPAFKIVEINHLVEKKNVTYNTKYEDNPNEYVGYEQVKQQGVDGIQKVVSKVQKINGQIMSTVTVGTPEEIKETVDKIVIRGTKKRNNHHGGGNASIDGPVHVPVGGWVFPTNKPYTITSGFGWRWGKIHEGIDIAGTGYGSPVYAANNGLVVQSSYNGYNGHYIVIKHSNNYHTMYAHLANRHKAAGATVYAGDVIGTVGKSGFASGTHLHFGVYIGKPYASGSRVINPFNVVR